jgi:flavin reductase (DIM6/NTAB) family NADH-FMN oxidoreductase RutF
MTEQDGRTMLDFNPADHAPQDIYKLLVGSIVPRPIAFVSTMDTNGIANLAPFSFFTAASANPPVVCFCPMIRRVGPAKKDTLRNIEETGEFVINIVSEEFGEKMNQCAAEVPPEVNEFEISGLTPLASDLVRPPRVAESHVQMECRLLQLIRVSEKPMGGTIVIGEVLRFHVTDGLVEEFRIDPARLRALGRMAGSTYVRTTDRFDMERPGSPR